MRTAAERGAIWKHAALDFAAHFHRILLSYELLQISGQNFDLKGKATNLKVKNIAFSVAFIAFIG